MKAVLQFSGGKDSLALLHLKAAEKADFEVHFGDTGAVFPHVVEFVKNTCRKLNVPLRIVHPVEDIKTFQAREGFPTDLLPVLSTPQWGWTRGAKVRLQGTTACCAAMLWAPMYHAVVESGVKLVWRGVKKSDERKGVPPGFVDDLGIRYEAPLWDWTDEDVRTYLEREGIDLPAHYSEVNDSLDCWLCTGHTSGHYARDKVKYVKAHHPELWPELKARIETVRGAVDEEYRLLTAAFSEAGR